MKEVKIDPLTRVEGLGRVYVKYEDGKLIDLRLEIYEPPRFFEALLKGKKPDQVVDIVARICGLCPVAYQITAVNVFEKIFEIEVPDYIKKLRRVIYCGEWVSSHSAHAFFLHMPDFFKKNSFIELARERRELIDAGLQVRKAGNKIIEALGGRHIHPVNIKVGGFYKLPYEWQVEEVIKEIDKALPEAEKVFDFFLNYEFPEFERDYELVSLKSEKEYPIIEGRVVSSKGIDISMEDYERTFEEFQLPHSTALYSKIKGRGYYFVGAIARVNNNYEKLDKDIREKLKPHMPIRNPFKSIIARLAEIIYSLREAKKILERVELKGEAHVDFKPKEGEAVHITEAPRGILYHRYRVNEKGLVEYANIVPPTSQNQGIMEEDIKEAFGKLSEGDFITLCEKLIRNHDPCISCASHFIEVKPL